MLELTKKREYTFPLKYKEAELTFTFKFKYAEERDYKAVSDIIRNSMVDKPDDERARTKAVNDNVINIEYAMLRQCLIGCEGITVDGEPVKITKDDGSIDKEAQLEVFDFIIKQTELYEKIKLAYTGVTPKNS